MTRTGLVRAIGNAVPARAGYVVALPLLIAVLENVAEDLPQTKSQSKAADNNVGDKIAEISERDEM